MASLFGARYFGVRYYGARYFGGAAEAIGIEGIVAATEARDGAALAGDVGSVGNIVALEAPDIAAFAGVVASIGVLAASEARDVAVFVGFQSTAFDTDFRFPTAHTILTGGGWITPGNIYAKDGALCSADHNEPNSNWYLKTEGFGFTPAVIPADAVVLKVELETRWQKA